MIAVAKPETRHPTNLSGAPTNCRLPVGALSLVPLDASTAQILWPGISPAFPGQGEGLFVPAGWEPGLRGGLLLLTRRRLRRV
jgi:hypothetical protein